MVLPITSTHEKKKVITILRAMILFLSLILSLGEKELKLQDKDARKEEQRTANPFFTGEMRQQGILSTELHTHPL